MGIRDTSKIIESLLWRYFFMGRKTKYSKELKLEIVKRYLKGESPSVLANEYCISSDDLIYQWIARYRSVEINCLNKTRQKET